MAPEISSAMVEELEEAYRMRTSLYLITQRPWLDLYGVRLRPVAGYATNKPPYDPSLLHRVLPDELLHELFVRLPPYDLGRASCVCRKWRYALRSPLFWRMACLKAWQLYGVVENYKLLHFKYGSSWRKMWLFRPRVRSDGLYVSRNTYIHAGVAEWRVTKPVHLVCYYRYIRFFASGKFLYKNSSQKVKDVAKIMNIRASKADRLNQKNKEADCVQLGQFTLSDDQVEAVLLYPGRSPVVWRIRLRLRGTTPGANNRMDCLSLVTSGVNSIEAQHEDMLNIVEGWEDDETHNPNVPARSHKMGLNTFVFVPFEEVETSVLNLPVDKMDYYVPD